jgi:hypothetical protein
MACSISSQVKGLDGAGAPAAAAAARMSAKVHSAKALGNASLGGRRDRRSGVIRETSN